MAKFDNKTIYIIDSYGLIYRNYFAFISRPLLNKEGKNISALFGFFRSLYAVLDHYKPEYILAALDSKTPTFRHKMYDQYKANRPKTPEDLHAQIPWIEEILNALKIPVLQCDGYEADDIIATVSEKCGEMNRTCRILTADKDLMQLVNDSTQVLKPDRQDTWKITGIDGVQAEWGVQPELMLDLLSLTGDSADNIPGVKGVGIKTAVKYLLQYGNLDEIYAHADEIKGSIGQKIRTGKENAYFSRDLVKLNRQVPFTARDGSPFSELSEIKPTILNYSAAAELLKQYGAFAPAKKFSELENKIKNGTTSISNTDKLPELIFLQNNNKKNITPENADITPLHKNIGIYRTISDIDIFSSYIDELLSKENKLIALNCQTATNNPEDSNLIGFSFSDKKENGIYIPLSMGNSLFETPSVNKKAGLAQIQRLFTNENIQLVMHNAKAMYKTLRKQGLFSEQENYIGPHCKIIDTMIADWLLEPDLSGKKPYQILELTQRYLAIAGTEYDDLVEKKQTLLSIEENKIKDFSTEQADFTLQLWKCLQQKLEKAKLFTLFETIEMKLLPILAEMELTGIHLDTEKLSIYSKELETSINSIQKEIYELVGHEFNIASTKQLQEVLFTERGLKPEKKTKTGYSTDTGVLEALAEWDPVPKKILDFRTMSKLKSTYVDALPSLIGSDNRIHTTFVQTGTATGRLSCRDPNLQNIPIREESGRRIRSAFSAEPGKVLISADYSQIELVVLAHLSQDKNLCDAFKKGIDVHRHTASLIYNVSQEEVTPEMRRTAKTINFGVMYGMSAFRLSNTLDIPRTQAASFIENYFKTYAAIREFIDNTIQEAERKGYVETIFGRKREIKNINIRNKTEKAAAERIAVNTPIQGSAADIVKKAMIDVQEALITEHSEARLLLQVHDELILQCPDNQNIIKTTINLLHEKMENTVLLSVPLRVSIEYGKKWGEFH